MLVVKNFDCQFRRHKRPGFDPWVGKNHKAGMATHSSILAWKIPWTEELGGPQSIGSQRVGHKLSNLACRHMFILLKSKQPPKRQNT